MKSSGNGRAIICPVVGAVLLTLSFGYPLRQAQAAMKAAPEQPISKGSRPDFASARAFVQAQLRDRGVASISVAVASHGKIIWQEGFGWANREENIPANEDTMYSLASVTKPFTATGLMTLVEAHKVDLDRPVNDYLGDAKLQDWSGGARATVRQVADHTSGLPLFYEFFPLRQPVRPPSPDDTILHYGNIVSAPGTHYQYSNLGYGILSYVEERTSQLSYADFLRKSVFLPLGLNHTSVGIGPGLERFEAIRYEVNGKPIPFYVTDHPGASEIYSSAHDLIRFAMFHLEDHLADQTTILSDRSIDEMHRALTATDEAHDFYGLGWETDKRADGYTVVYHGGGMPGVTSLMQLVPSEDMAVVILANTGEVNRKGIANEIWKALLPGWRVPAPEPDQPRSAPGMSSGLVGRWNGWLHTPDREIPVALIVTAEGEARVKVGNHLESLLNKTDFHDGRLVGVANDILETADAERHHTSVLALDLQLSGKRLYGSATAESFGADYAALPYRIEFTR